MYRYGARIFVFAISQERLAFFSSSQFLTRRLQGGYLRESLGIMQREVEAASSPSKEKSSISSTGRPLDPNHPGPAESWRTRPAMLRVACGVQSGRQVGFNYPETAFPIETDHFSGRMYFRLRYLEGEPTEYFRGRTRKLSCVVQGRFKHALPMSECFTGYEFERPMDNVPAHWLISTILRAVKKLAPTVMIDVLGPKPYILNPLFQTIQLLHVAHPGEEPPLTAYPLREQTALLGGVFAQKPFDRLQRKNYFASTRNGEKHTLQPGLVYTMEFYEDKMDFSTFEFAVIGMRFGLARCDAHHSRRGEGGLGGLTRRTPHPRLAHALPHPSLDPTHPCLTVRRVSRPPSQGS